MKDTNLQIEDFKDSLIDIINTAELPPAVIYYVFTDVYRDIADTYKSYLSSARRKQVQPQQVETVPLDENE